MTLTTNQYTFAEVFPEFYALWRGRTTNLPTFSTNNREYILAIHYANEGIKKWDRTDGVLWRELIDLGSNQSTGVWPTIQRTIASGTTSYTMPTNMRKTPAAIRVGTGTTDIPVIEPQDVLDMGSNTTFAYFTGGANGGYTLVIPSALATQYNGQSMDFIYYKKPTLLRTDVDPAATVIEMSDSNFLIQHMVMLRALKQRDTMRYNTAQAEASAALQNMKIENMSGNYDHSWNSLAKDSGGWGKAQTGDTFFPSR